MRKKDDNALLYQYLIKANAEAKRGGTDWRPIGGVISPSGNHKSPLFSQEYKESAFRLLDFGMEMHKRFVKKGFYIHWNRNG